MSESVGILHQPNQPCVESSHENSEHLFLVLSSKHNNSRVCTSDVCLLRYYRYGATHREYTVVKNRIGSARFIIYKGFDLLAADHG
jgi:hypothetical protein